MSGINRTPLCGVSLEVLIPSAFSHLQQQNMVKLASLDPLAPSGVLNLLTPFRHKLTGLLSCQIRSWDHPSELCSFREAVCCFQHPYPLDVLTAFRVLLNAKVRHPRQLFKLNTSTWLSWVFTPSGYSTSLLRLNLRRTNPHTVTKLGANDQLDPVPGHHQ